MCYHFMMYFIIKGIYYGGMAHGASTKIDHAIWNGEGNVHSTSELWSIVWSLLIYVPIICEHALHFYELFLNYSIEWLKRYHICVIIHNHLA